MALDSGWLLRLVQCPSLNLGKLKFLNLKSMADHFHHRCLRLKVLGLVKIEVISNRYHLVVWVWDFCFVLVNTRTIRERQVYFHIHPCNLFASDFP